MNNNIELYDPTMKQAIDSLAEDVSEKQEISKKRAKLLVLNALLYNTVIEEVNEQVAFLIENGALETLDEIGYRAERK